MLLLFDVDCDKDDGLVMAGVEESGARWSF